jgi:choline dehydrogenase
MTYDLIIVGAGTAGCVLAEHMTRSGKLNVLLIEAGGKPKSRFVSIPAGFTKLFKSDHDWAFESEPQTGVGGRRIFTPRGKMLGGSSNINAQIHQWCHPADFDGWAEDGAEGWDWNSVAEMFKAQECLAGADEIERGRDGLMKVCVNENVRPLTSQFVEAANGVIGGEKTKSYNGRAFQGAWVVEMAHHRGKRFSVYNAFLEPAMKRENLEVVTDAHTLKVVIEESRATGVKIFRDGQEETFSAPNVILSAGAFGSPQILMHSGIGPADALREFGLPVRVNSADVGQNLQDHPVLPLTFRCHSTDTLKNAESPLNLLKYLLFKRGMLASNGIEAIAFTQVHPEPKGAADLELIFVPFDARKEFLEPPQENAFGIGVAVVYPRSRGQIFLRGKDPRTALGIDFGLFTDPEGIDRKVLLEGIKLTRRIVATPPLTDENLGGLLPEDSLQTEEELLDFAASEIQTVYHPTSTCRMGSDDKSVVDPKLEVRGVGGLWVVDASVMPTVPRGHPNAVVAMVAGRAAEWIEEKIAGGVGCN